MATETVTVNSNEVPWGDDIAQEFDNLVEERQLHASEAKRHDGMRKDLDKIIETMLLLTGDEEVVVQSGQWTVQRVTNPGQSKLSAKKLLEQGVSASIIQAAMEQGQGYSYVLIKSTNKGD